MNIDNMNSMLLDVLKEIGNIGSGNAATALASMIDKKVDMDVPQVKILEFKDITDVLGGAEIPVVGIYFEMSGDIDGNIMFILNYESAVNLVNMLFNRANSNDNLEEMDMSALSEVGNILAASYINSLSSLTGMTLKISIPSINIDMAGAILSVPAVEFGQLGDKILFIETQFEEDDKRVAGDLFLIPKIDSFGKMMKKLGVS
ncbi:chemotaxis protein CheC [Sporosalibacterium faouarense]|uniref:chemotaxis protein CheC n=1 Tax=Sporosalibacterium faouarense TaxID=516123 RepID=UPI00141C52C8|nr:chemotaxis protein CheC [Sporosalibacterium faouarense]MTI48015.1 chemotaxis protein CheC [Bacillota bacterium]